MFRGNEEKVIYGIVDDILELEDKIEDITSRNRSEADEKQKEELSALKLDKEQNNLVMSNIKSNLNEVLDENNKNIKKKKADITKLQRTITDIESQMRNLAVASATASPSNGYHVNYEKIEDIINTKKTNDDLKLLEQEYASFEGKCLSIEEALTEKLNRKNELSENLQMMKEEKTMIQYDLINIISQKESLEEMAKLKLHIMKSGENSAKMSLPNSRYAIKTLELFRYEISHVDLNKISREISEALIDLNDDIVSRTYLLNMIKNESIDYLRNSNWKKNPNDFLSIITAKGINILQSISTLKELTEENLQTYFKALFKVNYYEKIIAAKITFVSKEYKAIKKEMKGELNKLQTAITKLNTKKEELEGKIKEIKYKMNVLVDNKAKNGIGLSHEEKIFLQLNDKINELNTLKEEIVYELDQLTNNTEALQLEANDKIKEVTMLNESIIRKINRIENDIKANHLKVNEEIVQIRQLIADKFRIIKTQLKIYKEQYGNNLDLYNRFVDNINSTLRMSSILKPSYSSLIIKEDLEAETNRNLLSSFRPQNSTRLSQTYRSEKHKSMTNQHQFSKTPQKTHKSKHHYYNNKQYKYPEDIGQNQDLVNYDNYLNPNTSRENILHSPYKKTINSHSSLSPTRNKQQQSINNNTSTILDEDKLKLEKTIQKLKSSISKNENLIDREISKEKLKAVIKTTFCYFRLVESNINRESKFNPLEHSASDRSFGFTKAYICLNSKLSTLSIKQTNGIVKELSIDEIESTIVTNVMKYIIKICRSYRRAQSKKVNIEDFIKKDEFRDIPLNSNEKIKAAVNQLFNMVIKLNYDQRIEFVFISYEDFKLWLNGLGLLIKNKAEISKFRTMSKK